MVFDRARELIRREATGDDKYYRDFFYFFELIVPPDISGGRDSFLFPLVLNPDEISMEEPFSVTATATTQGGLWVEENGIVQRMLRIKGTTGFKPRPYRGSFFVDLNSPERRSYERDNAITSPPDQLSGQRHFQFLQDAVFRTYADLKRDPATSFGTQLRFHNIKDDEHWLVVPQKFSLMRNASARGRTCYDYNIEMLVVDKATANDEDFSEDKNVIDAIKDGFNTVASAVELAQATFQDVVALTNEIKNFVSNVGTILNNVVDLVQTAGNFINGVSELIETPIDTVTSLANQVDIALVTMSDAIINFTSPAEVFPDAVQNAFRRLSDSLDRFRTQPDLYEPETRRRIRALIRGQELSTSRTKAALEAAARAAPANSFQQYIAKGTSLTTGALNQSRSERGVGRQTPQFQSAREYTVAVGDTLQNIAAQQLGDARLYKYIAELNNLRAPFLSDRGLPGTKKVGEKLLVPSFSKAPKQRTLAPTLGVDPSRSQRERFLGTDLVFSQQPGPGQLFDFEIDTSGGSVDLRTVSEIDNLKQAMLIRLRTERGTNKLYTTLGTRRLVGLTIPADVEDDLVRFRIGEAILADPRIAALRLVQVTREPQQNDIVNVEINAEVRDLNDPVRLNFGGF